METTAGKGTAMIVKNCSKGFRMVHNLNWRNSGRVWGSDSNSERISTVNKMLSNSIACHQEITCERKSQSNFVAILCQEIALTAALTFSNHHPDQSQWLSTLRQDPLPTKRWQLVEGSDDC